MAIGILEITIVAAPKRLLSRLDDYAVGDTVRLKVLRGNQEREVAVRLQAGVQ